MKKIVISCAVALSMMFTGCENKQELHVYTWSDYIAPELIQQFEQENNCHIIIDTFDSNETMYAKLKAGGTGYDVIMPSSYFVELLVKEDIIEKLDHSKIPNVKQNFDKKFENLTIDGHLTYNVPYAISYTGFMYLKNKVSENEVDTWTILTNENLKGKITLLDDIREVIGAGLIVNGYSASSTNKNEIIKATETVLSWKDNLRKFDAESYKSEVANGSTYIGQGYSMDAYQVILGCEEDGSDARNDIGFVLPKEGFAVSCDEMTISKQAPQKDLAYKFISFMYKPENAKINMEYIVGLMPVKQGIELLDEDFRKIIVLSDDLIKKGHILRQVDNKTIDYYNDAWDKIKAIK